MNAGLSLSTALQEHPKLCRLCVFMCETANKGYVCTQYFVCVCQYCAGPCEGSSGERMKEGISGTACTCQE